MNTVEFSSTEDSITVNSEHFKLTNLPNQQGKNNENSFINTNSGNVQVPSEICLTLLTA